MRAPFAWPDTSQTIANNNNLMQSTFKSYDRELEGT